MNDDELRANLRASVPEPPDAATWAGEARLRHGRRVKRAMTGGVAVVVLAVVGAFLWPSLNGSGRVAVPAASPSPAPVPSEAVTPGPTPSNPFLPRECQGLVPSRSPVQEPIRADRLRLCPTARSAASTFTPLDPVLGDAAAAVLRTLNGLPKPSKGHACTDESTGPSFLLVAEADGLAPVVMTLEPFGCELAGIADAPRVGAGTVLDSFTLQLNRQRELIDRPATTRTGPLCGALKDSPTSVMPMSISEATGGRFCVYESRGKPVREFDLSGPDLRAILADIPGRVSDFAPIPCPYPQGVRATRIALTSFHGDVVLLTQSCGGMFVFTIGTELLQWKPSAGVAKRLETLAGA